MTAPSFNDPTDKAILYVPLQSHMFPNGVRGCKVGFVSIAKIPSVGASLNASHNHAIVDATHLVPTRVGARVNVG